MITNAITAAMEWLNEQTRDSSVKPSTIHQRTPAPPSTPVLKTDAAWKGDSLIAGLGWIVEDELQKVQRMAHCHFVPSPLLAEGLALREALQF